MPGFWGSHLGLVDLRLEPAAEGWRITDFTCRAQPAGAEDDHPLITGPALMAHHRTLRHFRRRIGRTEKPLNSYFALIGDDPGLRLVAMAQRWHVRQALRGSCWQDLPILTAAAPFRAGGRGGPQHYTDVPAGGLTLRNIADLYLFPNWICAIHLTGAEVREWLERSASMFLRVEPGKLDQPLIDPDFPSYNFDIIDGLEWQIDPRLPPRYTPDGRLANGDSHRIGALTHRSRPVAPNQPFILLTNSFRLSNCGLFGPATAGRPVVLDGASRTRDILRRYVAQRRVLAPMPAWAGAFAPCPAPRSCSRPAQPPPDIWTHFPPGSSQPVSTPTVSCICGCICDRQRLASGRMHAYLDGERLARASASPTRSGPEGSSRNEPRLGRCPASHPFPLIRLAGTFLAFARIASR